MYKMELKMTTNVLGMQADRHIIRPILEAEFPAALEWPHNWTADQIREAMGVIGRGRTNKGKRAALGILAGKLAEVGTDGGY
jgi:hypothetical protein